jgi:hypothetical protein
LYYAHKISGIIKDSWPEEWIPEAKAKMQEFWQTEYKSIAVQVDIPVLES